VADILKAASGEAGHLKKALNGLAAGTRTKLMNVFRALLTYRPSYVRTQKKWENLQPHVDGSLTALASNPGSPKTEEIGDMKKKKPKPKGWGDWFFSYLTNLIRFFLE